ncbi:MAG TPA: sialidase family protein [Mycobacteriales bacterium]|nr:sialidase family protein [Mycobacteriales bacterium]
MRVRKITFALLATGLAGLTVGAVGASSATAASAPGFTTVKLPKSYGTAEPRAVVAPDGTSYVVTNGGAQNDLGFGMETVYRSADGVHWSMTKGQPADQTEATTDVDIVATHTNRIITSELDYGGINFRTDYSDDGGKTWTSSAGTTYADTDRQWYAVGPDDPTTHQPRVYLLFHNLLSGVVQHNMFVATSTDGGATFGPPVPVATPPQQDYLDLQCADSGGPSNITVDQHSGRVYVVFGTRSSPVGGGAAQPTEVNVVAANRVWVVSADAADTQTPGAWTPHLAVNDTGVNGGASHIVGMQLAPGAVDTKGNVYVAYPESVKDYPDYDGAAIKVVHAAPNALDKWSKPSVVAPSGGVGNVLPHIVAGGPGKIDLAWYHGTKVDGKIRWYSYAAQSLDALTASPHYTWVRLSPVIAEPNQTASELMGACMQGQQATLNGFACGRSTDVNGIALDKCGRLLVAWPAQANLSTDATYVSQQTSGPTVLPCKTAPRSTGGVTVSQPATQGGGAGGGGIGLASTGMSRWPAVGAALLLVVAGGLALARRRLGS